MKIGVLALALLFLAGCANVGVFNPNDDANVYKDDRSWYEKP